MGGTEGTLKIWRKMLPPEEGVDDYTTIIH
jgi:hypothetical protein